ncbi:MAG: UrcA family protein [Caulobacteraceae bacterium]
MKTLTLLTLAALALPALAHATPSADLTSDTAHVKVSFSDLNLDRTRDASVLLERVQTAALESCGASTFSLPDYRDAVQRSACYRAGVAQAVGQIDAPKLTALYGARTAATAGEADAAR